MDQDYPAYRAAGIPRLKPRVTQQEYLETLAAARQAGLRRFAI